MRRILKIIGVVFAVLIIILVVGLGVVFLDVAGSMATGAETLPPNGAAVGKALVVYDPGLTGMAKDMAAHVADRLQLNGYTVTFAGVKSAAAANTSGYAVIVVGGPIYGGKPASSIQTYLNSLNPPQGAKVGVFGAGSLKPGDPVEVAKEVAPLPDGSSVTLKATMKITSGDDISSRSSDFATELLK
jgi:flavodoxin